MKSLRQRLRIRLGIKNRLRQSQRKRLQIRDMV
jgi:hypothetical protein